MRHKRSKTDNRSSHPLYKRWHDMRQRCENTNHPSYKNYGGRGIKLSIRWQDFRCFLEDMGDVPFPKATIERIDNDGDYSPDNCKWATYSEQLRNKRNNRMYTLDGVTQPRIVWCEEYGIDVNTFRARMRNGWELKDALTRPTLKIGWAIRK